MSDNASRRSRIFRMYGNCFDEVLSVVDNKFSPWPQVFEDAARVFDDLAKMMRELARAPEFSPQNHKKAHDPEFDRFLLATYNAASNGQKLKALDAIRGTRTLSAMKRRLARLQRAHRQQEAESKALADAMFRLYQRGDLQGVRDLFVDHMEMQVGRKLPDEWRAERQPDLHQGDK